MNLLDAAKQALYELEVYKETIANNQCVDYRVCCGVATDLPHTEKCSVIAAYDSLRAAIEEAEKAEPWGWALLTERDFTIPTVIRVKPEGGPALPLYTHPTIPAKYMPCGDIVKASGSLKDIHIIRWRDGFEPIEGMVLYTKPGGSHD